MLSLHKKQTKKTIMVNQKMRNKGQSLSRQIKRGHVFTRKNETLNILEVYRRSSRGREIITNRLNLQ